MIRFKKFPIGFWPAFPPNFKWTKEEVLRWKKCGITLTISPYYDPKKTDKKHFFEMLDFCAEQGIYLIVHDERGRLSTYKNDPENYKAIYQTAVDDFGDHPAVVGFFIGDEPYGDTIIPCQEICRIQKETAPHLLPYLNFLPYEGLKDCGYNTNGKTFDKWIDDFAKESKTPAFSYDCYFQMNPEGEYINNFFENLRNYKKAAVRHDAFLFSIMLGVGHFRYRVPNEDELRWQFNGAVATGANGILWFTFYTPVRSNNYRGGAIDEFGDETETYRALSRLQRKFNRDYAEHINTSKHLFTLCIGRQYGGYDGFCSNEPLCIEQGVLAASSTNGVPGMLSFFQRDDGKKFLLVFNNSYKDSDLFKLTLKGSVKKVYRLYGEDKIDFEVHHWDAHFRRNENAVEVGIWLAPGQFDLFELEY